MNVTPDGLGLGPLALSWANLTLVLIVLTWTGLARFAQAGAALGMALLTARVWAAWPGFSAQRPLLENLLDVLDLRRGDWAWGPGVAAGLVYLLLQVRLGRLTARQFWRPLALTLLAGLLPALLRPAPAVDRVPATTLPVVTAQRAAAPAPLPRPTVLNFWATWCGPCRAELPLLAREMEAGAAVTLVNVGESAGTVQTFLREAAPTVQTHVGGEALAAPLRVTAFPTTIVVDGEGRVVARHLGPLSAGQLGRLLRQAER